MLFRSDMIRVAFSNIVSQSPTEH